LGKNRSGKQISSTIYKGIDCSERRKIQGGENITRNYLYDDIDDGDYLDVDQESKIRKN